MPHDPVDVAIITVLPVEAGAVRERFKILPESRTHQRERIFHHGSVYSNLHQRDLTVVVGCVGKASQADAALLTSIVLDEFDPALTVLCGISAGLRGKVKVGDVVRAREIVDVSMNVAEAGQYKPRPTVTSMHPQVQQMFTGFTASDELYKEGFAARCGIDIIVPPKDAKIYEEEVADNITIHDSGIATADVLLRDPQYWERIRGVHEGIRASEMEAGGFLKAMQNGSITRPWLVVRGISDFGDALKNDKFHILASHSAAAFTFDFLSNGADINFIRPRKKPRKSTRGILPTVSSSPASGMVEMSGDTQEPKVKPSALSSFETALLSEFENLRTAWRNSPNNATLTAIRSLPTCHAWQEASSSLKARVLRFSALLEKACGGDEQTALRLANDAKLLSPEEPDANDLRLSIEVDGAVAVLDKLAAPKTVELWNVRLIALLRAERFDEIIAERLSPPLGIVPDAESRRIFAWALLHRNLLVEAQQEAEQAEREMPDNFYIKISVAVCHYFNGLIPDYAKKLRKDLPVPTDPEFLRADALALATFRKAEQEFASLLNADLADPRLVSELQGWRLATLANDVERQAEAQQLCAELLRLPSPNQHALQWAIARNYPFELDSLIQGEPHQHE